MKNFFLKMNGGFPPPARPGGPESLRVFIGCCVSLSLLSFFHSLFLDAAGLPLLAAPFGASAALVFGASRSPLAQPRNVIGGHILSGLVGVIAYKSIGAHPALAVSLAVPAAIALMHFSGLLHPPGGATAFVAAAGGPAIHEMGYWYVLTPCAAGGLAMIATALIINNLSKDGRYPQFW